MLCSLVLNTQDLEMLNKANSENAVLLEMHHVRNYGEFLCINNRHQCYNGNEDCEKTTLEQVAVKRQKKSGQESVEDDN
jgi:hypothetical protein